MGGIVTKRIAFAIKVLLAGRKAFSKSHYSDSAVSGLDRAQILVGIFRSTISRCRAGDVERDLIGLTQGTIARRLPDRLCPVRPCARGRSGRAALPGHLPGRDLGESHSQCSFPQPVALLEVVLTCDQDGHVVVGDRLAVDLDGGADLERAGLVLKRGGLPPKIPFE